MYYFFRLLVSAFLHIRYRITLYGGENVPKGGGYIIACNHQSYSDPPLIAGVIRGKFSFMAKSELFEKNKIFAWIIRRCGAFPVHRGAGDSAALDKAVADIGKGRIFVIFPEGTRSKTGVIGRGKSGVALIASKAGAPVLPMCIYYGEKRRTYIAIGEMIPAEKLSIDAEDRKALRSVSNTIMDGIKGGQRLIFDTLAINPLAGIEEKETPENEG